MAKSKHYKCFYCKQYIIDSPQKIEENKNRYIHEECIEKFRKEEAEKEELEARKKAEYEEWNKLYQYMKEEIYKIDGVLPKHMINKLKALRNGQYNLSRGDKVETGGKGIYSYDTILKTIQFNKAQILKGLRSIQFKDDIHKVNYIISIVTNNINDIDSRIKNKNKASQKLNEIVIDTNQTSQFVDKNNLEKNKVANALEDLF